MSVWVAWPHVSRTLAKKNGFISIVFKCVDVLASSCVSNGQISQWAKPEVNLLHAGRDCHNSSTCTKVCWSFVHTFRSPLCNLYLNSIFISCLAKLRQPLPCILQPQSRDGIAGGSAWSKLTHGPPCWMWGKVYYFPWIVDRWGYRSEEIHINKNTLYLSAEASTPTPTALGRNLMLATPATWRSWRRDSYVERIAAKTYMTDLWRQ